MLRAYAFIRIYSHDVCTGEDATPWLLTFSSTNVITNVDPMLRSLYAVSRIYPTQLQHTHSYMIG